MQTLLIVLAALLLDRLLGEPRRWHPLVGFGQLAIRLERRLNQGDSASVRRGALAWLVLVLPPVALVGWLASLPGLAPWLSLLLLWLALGGQSLREHGLRVAHALQHSGLEQARHEVAMLVSRDTATMDAPAIARATTESMLENGNDAIFATLFWFALLGAPGVVLYRLVNTLDAMWGYRTPRYLAFGRVAARADDLLNLVPARLTALSYALLGNTAQALRCWREQARHCDSPNGGPVMASGAGAIGYQLGGPAYYHGALRQRPWLGLGKPADAQAIHQALALIQRSVVLWLLLAGGWLLVSSLALNRGQLI